MKQSLYLETSVISYYTALPVRDIIVLAHQEVTRQWWPRAIRRFRIFISEVVIEEIKLGNPRAAEGRLKETANFPHLALNSEVERLAQVYIKRLAIPKKSLRDAVHLALCCVHNIDYLVTWNCGHLANGEVIRKITRINDSLGIHTPVICTPEELLEV